LYRGILYVLRPLKTDNHIGAIALGYFAYNLIEMTARRASRLLWPLA
jgi:hypothetical protein